MGVSLSSGAEERKRNTKRKDVCQVHSDHRQLPAGPAGTPPAGWRRLEDRGRWELEGGGQRDQGHPGVGRGEEGGGRVGGSCEGGCQPQVLQLRSPRHGGSRPPRRPLRLLWCEEGEPVPFEPSCSSMLTTPTSTSSRKRSATRPPRSTSRTLRSWLPGRSLCRTCSSGSLPASPPSSSSSRSPSAVERGGRRECKNMLRLYRLNQAHSAISFSSNIFLQIQ